MFNLCMYTVTKNMGPSCMFAKVEIIIMHGILDQVIVELYMDVLINVQVWAHLLYSQRPS